MMMVNPSLTTIKNNYNDDNSINSTSLVLKPSTNLTLSSNQFNNFSNEQKTEAENVVNSNYYDIDQFQTLKFHEKISHCPLSH